MITAFSISVSAQTAKVKIQDSGLGKITVVRGKTRSVVDLSGDVSGCVYVPKEFRKTLAKNGCVSPPADFNLVDATEKNKNTFLILTADAQENCNVCGRCGASEATTIIWLKLDARLRVLEKKNIPLDYCMQNISTISPISESNEETQNETWILPFKNDVMTIEFEKAIFKQESDSFTYEFTRVEYDRTKPEQGFVIKTEKREKSSLPEQ